MKEWQVREKHHTDTKALMKRLDFMDASGRVRRFNGPMFWPEFNAMGHSATSYEACECRKKIGAEP